jgi:hypothetical protein
MMMSNRIGKTLDIAFKTEEVVTLLNIADLTIDTTFRFHQANTAQSEPFFGSQQVFSVLHHPITTDFQASMSFLNRRLKLVFNLVQALLTSPIKQLSYILIKITF